MVASRLRSSDNDLTCEAAVAARADTCVSTMWVGLWLCVVVVVFVCGCVVCWHGDMVVAVVGCEHELLRANTKRARAFVNSAARSGQQVDPGNVCLHVVGCWLLGAYIPVLIACTLFVASRSRSSASVLTEAAFAVRAASGNLSLSMLLVFVSVVVSFVISGCCFVCGWCSLPLVTLPYDYDSSYNLGGNAKAAHCATSPEPSVLKHGCPILVCVTVAVGICKP